MDTKEAIFDILNGIFEIAYKKIDCLETVLDFSECFQKKKTGKVLKGEDVCTKAEIVKVCVGDVVEIPDGLVCGFEEMVDRKFLDCRRWMCISRPQYSKSCGITSLVSCWNFLYSVLGYGKLPVLSQEKALITLGIDPPFQNIRFGPFTGNNTLISWFNLLNLSFNLKGQGRIIWKLHGKNRTEGKSPETALKEITAGLTNPKKAYIYHCFNHYMCPIGYEIASTYPPDAYKKLSAIRSSDLETFIIIAEASKAYPNFHIRKWDDIVLDISQQNPNFYNIRKPSQGIQTRTGEVFTTGKKLGKNLHCIIEFENQEP